MRVVDAASNKYKTLSKRVDSVVSCVLCTERNEEEEKNRRERQKRARDEFIGAHFIAEQTRKSREGKVEWESGWEENSIKETTRWKMILPTAFEDFSIE